jgi:putative membrane protein
MIDETYSKPRNEMRANEETRAPQAWWRRVILAALVAAYVVLWLGGVGHHLFFGAVAAEQNWLASTFLAVAGLIILLTASSRDDLLRLIIVAAFGLLFEWGGVRFGLPFGHYAYTEVLQPTVLGVPIVMAFAWMVLVAYVQQMRGRLNLPRWIGALVGAVWMTAIDLVIDPLAANQLGYWRWVEQGSYYGIPLSNFAGWFVCSFLLFVMFHQHRQNNLWGLLMGVSIILFFTFIALSFHLFTAALIGFGLCVMHFLVCFNRSKHSE